MQLRKQRMWELQFESMKTFHISDKLQQKKILLIIEILLEVFENSLMEFQLKTF